MPGSVRVPRLCRLERTAAVQHLVSTVMGQLLPGRDAFDLLAASFPGGSITGAPKIRAMEVLEGLEPVRRGPYTGMAGWLGPDGAMASSILIRTFVADGERLSLHVGGGITWQSEPGGGVGRDARQGPRAARRDRGTRGRVSGSKAGPAGLADRHIWIDGQIEPADGRHLSAFDRGFQLGDGVFETLRARGGRPTELAEHLARLRRLSRGLDIDLGGSVEGGGRSGDPRRCSVPMGLAGPDGDASVRITVSRGSIAGRGLLPAEHPAATIVIQAWPVPRHAGGPPRARAPPRRQRGST